jgi:hypothetical protein
MIPSESDPQTEILRSIATSLKGIQFSLEQLTGAVEGVAESIEKAHEPEGDLGHHLVGALKDLSSALHKRAQQERAPQQQLRRDERQQPPQQHRRDERPALQLRQDDRPQQRQDHPAPQENASEPPVENQSPKNAESEFQSAPAESNSQTPKHERAEQATERPDRSRKPRPRRRRGGGGAAGAAPAASEPAV